MAKITVPTRLEYTKNVYGISETKDVIIFFTSVAKAVKSSTKDDGKITASDMLNFIEPITKIPAMLNGIEKVPNEITDEITVAEQMELLGVVVSSGVLPSEAEEAVKDGLELVEKLKEFIIKYFIRE